MSIFRRILLLALIVVLAATACSEDSTTTSSSSSSSAANQSGVSASNPTSTPQTFDDDSTLYVVSGSENRELEEAGLFERFERESGKEIVVEYQGSLDIKLMLERGEVPYDAVWPANSIWLTVADSPLVRDEASIWRSPVVLGVKRSVAEELGWIDTEVTVQMILDAAASGDLTWMMTSATQSNSGASAYFGYLYALSDATDVLTMADLQGEELTNSIKEILGTIDRSSGSSGWLKDLFLREYNRFDGMVNYEAVIIEANRELVARGDEPLYVIYPTDGLAIADSPLAYVDHGNSAKRDLFNQFQEFLLSDEIQNEILSLGRRVGAFGLTLDNAPTDVFRPEWGIDTTSPIQPIRWPESEVIAEALNLYQTTFRKGSLTIYCVDYSASMGGQGDDTGEAQLESAMEVLLRQNLAAEFLLQASDNDITIIIPFDSVVRDARRVVGDDFNELLDLYTWLDEEVEPGGGTNIYAPVIRALDIMAEEDLRNHFPAIILMTDGQSNEGTYEQLEQHYRELGLDVPVFGITFGNADDTQMLQIADLTAARVYDGRTNLIDAFRSAKGNN